MLFSRSSLISRIIIIFPLAHAQSPTDYPNNVPGNCRASTQFDCGNGKCINFNLVRNCADDCGNNADEQCGANQILCDTLTGTGCGKCVSSATATSDCLDRRYSRLCEEGIAGQSDLPMYKCVNTPNCVLLKWLNDGVDDCGDYSDEDPCLQGFNCTLTNGPSNTQFTMCTCKGLYRSNGTVWARPDPLLSAIPGQCKSKPLQFDCGNGNCVDISKFRDCVPDCPNRSDESCWLGTTLCLDGCTCVPPASPSAPTCPARDTPPPPAPTTTTTTTTRTTTTTTTTTTRATSAPAPTTTSTAVPTTTTTTTRATSAPAPTTTTTTTALTTTTTTTTSAATTNTTTSRAAATSASTSTTTASTSTTGRTPFAPSPTTQPVIARRTTAADLVPAISTTIGPPRTGQSGVQIPRLAYSTVIVAIIGLFAYRVI